MATNKEFLIKQFANSTRKMAEALVYSDEWGWWWWDGKCDSQEEAVKKQIEWLKRKHVKPKPHQSATRPYQFQFR